MNDILMNSVLLIVAVVALILSIVSINSSCSDKFGDKNINGKYGSVTLGDSCLPISDEYSVACEAGGGGWGVCREGHTCKPLFAGSDEHGICIPATKSHPEKDCRNLKPIPSPPHKPPSPRPSSSTGKIVQTIPVSPQGGNQDNKQDSKKRWVFANGKCQVAQPGDNRMQYDTQDACVSANKTKTKPKQPHDLTWLWITLGLCAVLVLSFVLFKMMKKRPIGGRRMFKR
jgi:hypothetical protein